jgi:hypothetical protein
MHEIGREVAEEEKDAVEALPGDAEQQREQGGLLEETEHHVTEFQV